MDDGNINPSAKNPNRGRDLAGYKHSVAESKTFDIE